MAGQKSFSHEIPTGKNRIIVSVSMFDNLPKYIQANIDIEIPTIERGMYTIHKTCNIPARYKINLRSNVIIRMLSDIKQVVMSELTKEQNRVYVFDTVELTLNNIKSIPAKLYESVGGLYKNMIDENFVNENALYESFIATLQDNVVKLYPGEVSITIRLKYRQGLLKRISDAFELSLFHKNYYYQYELIIDANTRASVNLHSINLVQDQLLLLMSRLQKLHNMSKRRNMPIMFEPNVEYFDGQLSLKKQEDFTNVGLLGCIDIATKDFNF